MIITSDFSMTGYTDMSGSNTEFAEPGGSHRHSRFSTKQGVTIETYIEGTGPTVVMLPSYGRAGAEDFDGVATDLASAGFRVLRPQPRGVAGSTGNLNISLRDLADDVAMVIDQDGDRRAVILGHAFGNYVARMVAVRHADIVRGVGLLSASASEYPANIAETPARACDLDAPEADRLAALQLGFFAPGHDPHVWLAGWYPETFKMQQASLQNDGVTKAEWWASGTAPLLEVIPASDPFKPRDHWNELTRSFGSRVKTVVIEDASHALFPERPKGVTEAVLPWMVELRP